MTRLYLAGPLFTASERLFNRMLAGYLKAYGYEVFLPREHEPRPKLFESNARAIFKSDVAGLSQADIVIANFDGPDVDSGTAWEVGYAYATGKRVIGYRTDFRSAGDAKNSRVNLMLEESCHSLMMVSSLTQDALDVAFAIYQALIGDPDEGRFPTFQTSTEGPADASV